MTAELPPGEFSQCAFTTGSQSFTQSCVFDSAVADTPLHEACRLAYFFFAFLALDFLAELVDAFFTAGLGLPFFAGLALTFFAGATGSGAGGVEGVGEGAAASNIIFSACPLASDPSEVDRDEINSWLLVKVMLAVWVYEVKVFETMVLSLTPHSPAESSITVPFEPLVPDKDPFS